MEESLYINSAHLKLFFFLLVVVVYQFSISNVMVIGDIKALLYSKVHAVLECKKHIRCFIQSSINIFILFTEQNAHLCRSRRGGGMFSPKKCNITSYVKFTWMKKIIFIYMYFLEGGGEISSYVKRPCSQGLVFVNKQSSTLLFVDKQQTFGEWINQCQGVQVTMFFFFSSMYNCFFQRIFVKKKELQTVRLIYAHYSSIEVITIDVEPNSKCPFSNHNSQQRIKILRYHISVDALMRDNKFNTQNNEFFNW